MSLFLANHNRSCTVNPTNLKSHSVWYVCTIELTVKNLMW